MKKYVPQSKLRQYREDHLPKFCEITGEPLTMETSCVDHSHPRDNGNGHIRGVISGAGNTFLGQLEGAYRCLPAHMKAEYQEDHIETLCGYLEACMRYLRKSPSGYLLPVGARQLITKFRGLSKADQILRLIIIVRHGGNKKVTEEDINACVNAKDRTKLYKKLIQEDKY